MEQELFSEQERFVWTEIAFTQWTSGLGGRLFPVVGQAGWLAGWLIKSCIKSGNSPSNLFFKCLNRFLALLMLYQQIHVQFFKWLLLHITRLFLGAFFRSHSFPGQSLLLSTTVFNDSRTSTRFCYMASPSEIIFEFTLFFLNDFIASNSEVSELVSLSGSLLYVENVL